MNKNKPVIKQQEWAKIIGIMPATYSAIKHGNLFTKDKRVAVHMAELWGGAAIDYIKPSYRDIYGKQWPSLKKVRVVKNG